MFILTLQVNDEQEKALAAYQPGTAPAEFVTAHITNWLDDIVVSYRERIQATFVRRYNEATPEKQLEVLRILNETLPGEEQNDETDSPDTGDTTGTRG